MKIRMMTALAGLFLFTAAIGAERKLKISKRYLNFPISHTIDRKTLTFTVGGTYDCSSQVRLTDSNPDYWTFRDVTDLKGKTLVVTYDDEAALAAIVQADTIMGQSLIYKEKNRPQYHFTTRRGWINDPNGLVFLNGKYHLFYQHNPFEREWGNMHWGHATSSDMMHWEELPLALHPDALGTMFSGTAVIDENNTTGFGKKGQQPLVVAYTADGKDETQCLAYSLDEGKTFVKYGGNPVVDSHERWQTHDTRDPKLFWHEPTKRWIMVVNERNGNTIYRSVDMKQWEATSHLEGFWECPELFELPVQGREQVKKWVMWGASGTYMVGSFDGCTFIPETPKLQNMNGAGYAAQTFANMPKWDGRRIKMTWARLSHDDMPFAGAMLLPQEQTLRQTLGGLRLYSYPVKEVDAYFKKVGAWTNLSETEANERLKAFQNNDMLRIKARVAMAYATNAAISFQGQTLVDYDMNGNMLNGAFYAPQPEHPMEFDVDIYVDRTIVEVFMDGGAFSYSLKRNVTGGNEEGYVFSGRDLRILSLSVDTARSVWKVE